MFVAHNQVRLHDTDMAGRLFFANQFRFVQEAFEEFAEAQGIDLRHLCQESPYLLVIRHVEADYLAPLQLGDRLRIDLALSTMGVSSFALCYRLSCDERLVGTAKTVHVALSRATNEKMALPEELRSRLALLVDSCCN